MSVSDADPAQREASIQTDAGMVSFTCYRRAWLSVWPSSDTMRQMWCPRCGAYPGSACHTRSGRPIFYHHAARDKVLRQLCTEFSQVLTDLARERGWT